MSSASLVPEKLIGFEFWCSSSEPHLPNPAQFVDDQWSADERDAVLCYLRQGRKLMHWMGYSWCRFQCGEPDYNMETANLTNGKYCWPEGLTYYVEYHHVRLPDHIVEHILKQLNFPLEAANRIPEIISVDNSWWLSIKPSRLI